MLQHNKFKIELLLVAPLHLVKLFINITFDLVKILLILDFSFSALPWIYIIRPMVDNGCYQLYMNLRKNLTF